MPLPENIREKLIREGLDSYLDAKHCLKRFEQEIMAECADVIRRNIDNLRKKTKVTFLDKTEMYQGSHEDGVYIEVGITGKSENDYIGVGVWWERGLASAYTSRYVDSSLKVANSMFDQLRGYELEKEGSQKDGWYFSFYREIPTPTYGNLKDSLNRVLQVWLRVGTKFIELRKRYR